MKLQPPCVYWRGSVTDVATDLAALLDAEQLERLGRELLRRAGRDAGEELAEARQTIAVLEEHASPEAFLR